jgi:two-component system phosphate regulon response regulator PhoB/two-component system alkaline phosphatase synthesis response regulator PhoP
MEQLRKQTIAVVDDERDILDLVSINLKKAGFETAAFEDAAGLYAYLESSRPHLIVLDLMLPDADGFDVCKLLRNSEQYSTIPIIMLTAKGDEMDRILGLEFGADDYVVKPFSPRELVARVKAVLRRGTSRSEPPNDVISLGNILRIDLQKYEVYVHDKLISLTSTEFKILTLLSKRVGWVYNRNQILDYLWGNEKIVLDRTIDVHIKNLRDKLGDAGGYIKNIRGVGYKLDA